jgi:hypothetical protein
MTRPKGSTVKSQARSEQARALYAALPKDPATGRLLKRAATDGPPAPPSSAGGPADPVPFAPGRGLRRFRHRSS